MSTQLCSHLTNLDISTILKGRLVSQKTQRLECQEKKCHATDGLNLCLSCAYVGCSKYFLRSNQQQSPRYGDHSHDHALAMDIASLNPVCLHCGKQVFGRNYSSLARQIVQKAFPRRSSRLHMEKSSDIEIDDDDDDFSVTSSSESSTTSGGIRGIQNLGNTCFMNSIIQALSNCSPVRDHCLQNSARRRNSDAESTSIAVEFSRIMKELWLATQPPPSSSIYRSSLVPISPLSLYDTVLKAITSFSPAEQQDAQEFFTYFLDRFYKTVPKKLPFTNSATEDTTMNESNSAGLDTLFRGLLLNKITCKDCGYTTRKEEPFFDLSLDLPDQAVMHQRKTRSQHKISVCSLSDCINDFTKITELEAFQCAKCQGKCTKQTFLMQLPQVLCLHIKRFGMMASKKPKACKLTAHVSFPIDELVLEPIGTDHISYDLSAAVVHRGNTLSSGHYLTYGRNDGRWFRFDDNRATEVSKETLSDDEVYMLFYERVGVSSPPGSPSWSTSSQEFWSATSSPESDVSSYAEASDDLSNNVSKKRKASISSSPIKRLRHT